MKRVHFAYLLKPFVVPFLLIAGYELFVQLYLASGGKSSTLIVLPPPTKIIRSFFDKKIIIDTAKALVQTLATTLLGFSLGIISAVVIGTILGANRRVEPYFSPLLNFLRSLPVVLYVPITLVLLGPDLRLPILLAAIITALYGAVPVIRAVRDYDEEKILFLRARGYSNTRITFQFTLLEILTALSTSISIAFTLALAVTVVAEMLLQGLDGIGTRIIRARESGEYSLLWALTFILGVFGFLFHELILRVWYFAVPWTTKQNVH